MCTRLHLTFTEIQDNPLKRLDALFSLLPKISTEVFLFMGRDPVELAKRAKYKPPAMRVRDVCYTKNHLSVIIEVFRPLLKKGKVISWQSKRIRSHIRSGCVSITSSSPLSIEEKLFIINTKEICGIS